MVQSVFRDRTERIACSPALFAKRDGGVLLRVTGVRRNEKVVAYDEKAREVPRGGQGDVILLVTTKAERCCYLRKVAEASSVGASDSTPCNEIHQRRAVYGES